jgi:hypothetical protein
MIAERSNHRLWFRARPLTYGRPGAAFNTAGRITKITSQMGTEERQYGKLGETVYEKKTVNTFTDRVKAGQRVGKILQQPTSRQVLSKRPDGSEERRTKALVILICTRSLCGGNVLRRY